MTTTAAKLLTADEVLDYESQGRWELVRGVIREIPPADWEHGVRSASLVEHLGVHVRSHQLGQVLTNDPGFLIARNPDSVRAPDVAFISQAKVPEKLPTGWITVVPDLVVEVISPNDRAEEVQEKIADWLNFGVPLVWVVYSSSRSIYVYRPGRSVRLLSEEDTLDGEEAVPGFSLLVREVFA